MSGWRKKGNRVYLVIVAVCLFLQLLFVLAKNHPTWVEQYYSRTFYPAISYISIVLFAWLPFSLGDLFYVLAVAVGCRLFYLTLRSVWRKNWSKVATHVLRLVALILVLTTYFYINWGLNYFRMPVAKQLGLDTETITSSDHLQVLEKYIRITNDLREKIDLSQLSKRGVTGDLQQWMRQDSSFDAILSKSQINVKQPLSSTVVSYFGVAGYFNPFTQEAHANQHIPLVSYPFVTVHELLHQMGIGFEDECNFIAFCKLIQHQDIWYRYSAYYQATHYLLYPLYNDPELLQQYLDLLSPKVRQDRETERAFWQQYRGWINRVSNMFYDEYLKANNQAEGMERYSMMAKLVVAWEISKKKHDNY